MNARKGFWAGKARLLFRREAKHDDMRTKEKHVLLQYTEFMKAMDKTDTVFVYVRLKWSTLDEVDYYIMKEWEDQTQKIG